MQIRYAALIIAIAIVTLVIGYIIGHLITAKQVEVTTVTIERPITYTITTPIYTTITTPIHTTIATLIHTTVITTEIIEKAPPISVVDALGRIVVFEEKPRRIVSLAPSITEILFALGLGDRVVGVTSFCNYPPEVLKLVEEGKISVIGGYWNPDVEKILALRPDLVIGSAGTRPHLALKERLEEAGIKVLYVRGSGATNDNEIFVDIATIAKIFGIENKAEELIRSISSEINYVRMKLSEYNVVSQKVLVLLGPPSWGLWSVGGDTFLGWIISAAGGINIAQKFSGWPQLGYEYILSEDPDVIIVTGMGLSFQDIISDIEGTPLKETRAFKEGKVYVVDQEANDILVRPGPRIGKAVKLMAQILYPEIFGEPDIPVVYKLSGTVSLSTLALAVIYVS